MFILPALLAAKEPEMKLAEDLYEEHSWKACRTECTRILISQPDNSKALMLRTIAELRCGMDSIKKLTAIADNAKTPDEIATEAAYEAGLTFIKEKNFTQAFKYLKKTFLTAKQKKLFLLSGCLLAEISITHPELFKTENALESQLSSCSRFWTKKTRQDCESILKEKKTKGIAGRSIVWFYQTQISSAIGQRCSLYPSCSEYTRMAFQQYGLFMGLAMYGDRAIREPDAVADCIEPQHINGVCKVRDLLEDHDFWFKGNKHE